MELEHLKQNWDLLNQRLEANDTMTQELVKKMTCERGKSAVEKLKDYDTTCMAILFVSAVFCGASYYFEYFGEAVWANRLMLFTVITCVILTPFYGVMLSTLRKIDFSESLRNNILYANRYKVIFTIREACGIVTAIPIFAMMGLFYTEISASLGLWIYLIVWSLFGCTMGVIFFRKYLKYIRSIFDSLAELKALNEGKE